MKSISKNKYIPPIFDNAHLILQVIFIQDKAMQCKSGQTYLSAIYHFGKISIHSHVDF